VVLHKCDAPQRQLVKGGVSRTYKTLGPRDRKTSPPLSGPLQWQRHSQLPTKPPPNQALFRSQVRPTLNAASLPPNQDLCGSLSGFTHPCCGGAHCSNRLASAALPQAHGHRRFYKRPNLCGNEEKLLTLLVGRALPGQLSIFQETLEAYP
jgi:hypothetical protein